MNFAGIFFMVFILMAMTFQLEARRTGRVLRRTFDRRNGRTFNRRTGLGKSQILKTKNSLCYLNTPLFHQIFYYKKHMTSPYKSDVCCLFCLFWGQRKSHFPQGLTFNRMVCWPWIRSKRRLLIPTSLSEVMLNVKICTASNPFMPWGFDTIFVNCKYKHSSLMYLRHSPRVLIASCPKNQSIPSKLWTLLISNSISAIFQARL